jgi:ADP-heptose:LPS heptosyltransferase/GT2 family glycosyltransferase
MRLSIDEAVIDDGRVLRLRGWAAARAGIAHVRVAIGQSEIAKAVTGLSRPDIAKANPDFRDADRAGFVLVHELGPDLPTGPSFVRVQATDAGGQRRQVTAPVNVPPPPTEGTRPAVAHRADSSPRIAVSSGIACACDVACLCSDGRFVVAGWALADEGVNAIRVELDGLAAGEAQLELPRLDVATHYPQHPFAARSGFAFVSTTRGKVAPGPHILTLRLHSGSDRTRVLELPLTAVPVADLPPEARDLLMPPALQALHDSAGPHQQAANLRLELDQPALQGDEARDPLQGALSISGWAVARPGIEAVSVFIDDSLLGAAHVGMRREDIGAAFPDFPGSLLAGFALVLPPGVLPEGRHEIRVVAHAKSDGSDPVARAEKRFFLKVEPFHAVPPGGAPRLRIPPAEAALGEALLAQAKFRPSFGVLVEATGKAALPALACSLASLAAQTYADWTAEIFVPAAALAASRALPEAADRSGRVTFAGAKPGRKTAPPAEPRYLIKLRAGDVLGADALLEFALGLAANRPADLLYADELRFDAAQQRSQPFFKPDFSPELLLSMNYPGRVWCAAAALVAAAGLSAETLASGSDFDAVLRLSEHAAKIAHLPRVLCARGEAGDSAALEKSALVAALKRRRLRGTVEPGAIAGTWRVRRQAAPSKGAALVSIIIPTCSARGLIRRAIAAIRATTAPARPGGIAVEILALDNTPPADKAARAWLRKAADRVIDMPGPFNWSRFNNAGAAAARGDYLLFLNDDIEMSQPDWLEVLLEQASRPEVGVVGAKLLYPGGTVQHAGQYLADGHARHAFRFADAKTPGPFGLATVTREVIAVTGACQLMQRRVFDRLGGYEEAHSIVNNDLDFCLRSWQAGLAVIYTPHATLIHHELASRAALEDSYDAKRFSGAWRQRFLQGDPYRNPHLGPDSDHYGPEPEPAVWLHAGRRGPTIASVRRLLAVKLDHIGDFLTAFPALQALHAQFPSAVIDLLVPSATAALAQQGGMLPPGLPIGEIQVFDFFHARSGEGRKKVGEAEFAALLARLAPAAYDLAIDLRMHPETRPVLRYTGARLLAGYDHEDRFPWLDVALVWEGDSRLVRKRAHVSERLVQLVGATAAACQDSLVAAPPRRKPVARKQTMSEAFAALPAEFRARPVVCIHPGVGNVVRQWPAASFAALIDLLADQPGLHAVLIGSPDEVPIAEDILRKVTDPAVVTSLVGRVKLAQLPPLIAQCVLFVGNNSGPQHIAASLGIKALGIHSGVVDAAEWAPLGPQAMAIRRRMVCSPCYLEFASDCPRDLACLTGLLPRDVHAACLRLLAGGSQESGVSLQS